MRDDATAEPSQERYLDHPRVLLAVAVLVITATVIVAVGFYRHVVQAEFILRGWGWSTEGRDTLTAPRGAIVDTNEQVLAMSGHAPTIGVDPYLVHEREWEHVDAIRTILRRNPSISLAAFEDALRPEVRDAGVRYRVLGERVSGAEETMTALRALGVRGVYEQPQYVRRYPYGSLAGNLIGAFGGGPDGRGEAGLEQAWEAWLRPAPVAFPVTHDARRRAYTSGHAPRLEEVRGSNVQTSIDVRLQRLVEDTLHATIERFHAEQGVIVVSRPATGDVVAMAQYPGFDPSARGTRDGDIWLNLAVGASFEPGSTMKILTYAAAIDAGVTGEHATIDCHGGRYIVGGRLRRDTVPEGVVPLERAFQISSNAAAISLGRGLGQQRMTEYLRRFGIGEPLEMGLGSEASGRFKRARWSDSELATITYGYGVSLNALQLNMMTATIANGGVRMRPRLVQRVFRPDGTDVEVFPPQEVERAVSERAAAAVARFMTAASQNVRGATGRRAAIAGVPVAVKTGTAQLASPSGGYLEDTYVSSITGFLPSDDPRFVITILVAGTSTEFGYYGGEVGGPAFARIGASALLLDGVYLDEAIAALERLDGVEEEGEAGADSTFDRVPARARTGSGPGVPDVTGLWAGEAVGVLASRGYDIRVHGSGRVVFQLPSAGSLGTDTVELHLEHFDALADLLGTEGE
jgi:cell division protein FtsI (penicillin-binding protein 3)